MTRTIQETAMGNANKPQARKVALWRDRPVIILNERCGHAGLFHGLVLGPPGMDYDTALGRIDEVFREVVEANPEQWSYEDVLGSLAADGFEEVFPAEWWEHHVEMSDD